MSTDNEVGGELEPGDLLVDVSTHPSKTLLRLVRCPICYEDFTGETLQTVHRHIGTHDPEELGLTADTNHLGAPLADLVTEQLNEEVVE